MLSNYQKIDDFDIYCINKLISSWTPMHRGAFLSFLSGGFITAIVVNPPERKLAKRTCVHCSSLEIPPIYNIVIFILQEHLTYTVESLGDECLINAAKTSMSSKLIGSDSEFFSRMVVDAANAIKMSDGKGNILYLFSVKFFFSLENYN